MVIEVFLLLYQKKKNQLTSVNRFVYNYSQSRENFIFFLLFSKRLDHKKNLKI